MNIKNTFILLALVLALTSCTGNKKQSGFSFIKIKVFETPADFKFIYSVPSSRYLNPSDSTLHLFFQNLKSREIFSFSLSHDSLIPMNDIAFRNPEFFFKYFIVSNDSVFVFDNESKSLMLKNKVGDTLRVIKLNPEFTPLAMFPMGLMRYKNTILMGNTSETEGMGLKKERLSYYKAIKPILQIRLTDSTPNCKPITTYPEKYINTGDNYNNVFPSACFGKNNNICVSYGADDFIYSYNDTTLIIKKEVKSRFIDKFNPYPDEKRFDMLYLKEYNTEEPRYTEIIYDPYQNFYYRIVKHRVAKSNGNKKVVQSWSVIILDLDFSILGEELIGPEFQTNVFIPTPFGILLGMTSINPEGNAYLTLIKIKENE